jgi:hypothetical protein
MKLIQDIAGTTYHVAKRAARANLKRNVEWCNKSRSIKYLFKYIHKGEDRATVILSTGNSYDEIHMYIDARYLSAGEACWRIFGCS